MEICFQKKKQIIYSEACPEVTLRALAAAPETKLLTDCCRQAIRYAKEEPGRNEYSLGMLSSATGFEGP